MYLKTALEHFIAAKVRVRRSPHTTKMYRHHVQKFIDHVVHETGSGSDRHLTPAMIQSFLDHEEARRLSRTSLKHRVSALHEFVKFGLREKYWRDDPMLTIDQIRRPKRLPRPLAREQRDAILALELPTSETALRALLNYTGLRDQEICDLRLTDIQGPTLLAGDVVIPARITVRGKGDKERAIDLAPDAWAAIEAQADDALTTRPVTRRTYLFEQRDSGRPWTTRMIQRRVKAWGPLVGMAPGQCTAHRFRHRFATDLLESGADIRAVQDLMGHASLTSTEVYTQVVDQRRRDAILRAFPPKAIRAGYTTPAAAGTAEKLPPENHAP